MRPATPQAPRDEVPPQHDISIEPFAGTVNVMFSDAMIASTNAAQVLREPGHDPVVYIPFEHIYFEFLTKTNTVTRCPIKGTASYWRVSAVGEAADDFMWAYETPNPVAAAIAGHGAFDDSKARIEVVPAEDREHTPHIVE
jgi:uncharacterized protein (DUF427 family)